MDEAVVARRDQLVLLVGHRWQLRLAWRFVFRHTCAKDMTSVRACFCSGRQQHRQQRVRLLICCSEGFLSAEDPIANNDGPHYRVISWVGWANRITGWGYY